MNIGIDAREFQHEMTGISRHLNGLVKYMRDTPFEYFLYSPGKLKYDLRGVNIHLRLLSGPRYLWDHISLPWALAKDNINLFFSPYYKKPWSLHCRSIVTVHVLNILFDELYPYIKGAAQLSNDEFIFLKEKYRIGWT